MKFAENVLLEIVNIVQRGLAEGVDISEELRAVDVTLETDDRAGTTDRVCLSEKYLASKGRVF
jgi:hypothetical protein